VSALTRPGPQHEEFTWSGKFFMLWAAFEAMKEKKKRKKKRKRKGRKKERKEQFLVFNKEISNR